MRRLASRMVGALRALASRDRLDQQLDDELRAYLDEAVEQKLAAGMSRDAALRAARVEMGSRESIKEAVRDVGWESRLDGVVRDVRFACRTLRSAPGFTAIALVTLALGIGANTAVYSAIDAAFFRPLPFPNPEQIVYLRPLDVRVPQTVDRAPIGTRPVFVTDLHDAPDVFAHAAGYATGGLNLGSGPEPRRVASTFVTTGFFQLFGREPQLGRTFAPAEMIPGGPDVAVLSHALWQTQFGGDRSIVGQTVRLDDRPFIVVGVMPPDFRFPVQADLWLPLPHPVPRWTSNTFRNFFPGQAVARLAPGVTPEQAAARLDVIRRPWADSQTARGMQVTPVSDLLTPLQRHLAGNRDTAFALMVLMASAGVVLLVACANVATLLLSRAATRRAEITTHAVLGATRARIIRRLLAESLLLSAGGAALGVGVATMSLPLLGALIPESLTGLAPIRIDLRVLLFTAGLATAVGVAFGLWPALGLSHSPLARLQAAGARVAGMHGQLNRAFVVAEVALACLLVIAAGLLLTSLRSLLGHDLGMRPELVATAQLNLPSERYNSIERRSTLVRSVLEALHEMPGVHAAAIINTLPFDRDPSIGLQFRVDDDGAPAGSGAQTSGFSRYLVVSPGYFDTMGIRLLSGRDLAWSDTDDVPVVVVNRTLAAMLWPGEDPLGRRLRYSGAQSYTVVGLVEDARIEGPGTDVGPQVYMPIQYEPQAYLSIVARGTGPDSLSALLAHIRTAVTDTDPTLPVFNAQSLATTAGATIEARRVNTLLISVFGVLALALAVVGVYGLLAYVVAQRTRELGIRIALGAQPADVRHAVMRQGLVLVAIGLTLGVGAAFATTRYLESMLYGITPRDPMAFAGVVLVFVATTAVASYLPARRATRVDPIVALRMEN